MCARSFRFPSRLFPLIQKIALCELRVFYPLTPLLGSSAFGMSRKRDRTFTRLELETLYPADIRQALGIWGFPLALAWGLILRDTRCRPSEAIAWLWVDYSEKWGGFPITKWLREGTILPSTKSGVRRYRAAVLSEMGIQAIELL